MASLNPLTRELVFKLVFYGPGLGGKTTSLYHIHEATEPENRGNLVSLATPTDRTIYFDFLPIRLPRVRDLGVRLQLFTVPGQVYYTATRKLVLTGADCVVFVADSQAPRMEANVESLEDLERNLLEHGLDLHHFPLVFMWNKRDLPGVLAVDELERRLNPNGVPSISATATTGEGVFEALEAATRLAVNAYLAELPATKAAAPATSAQEADGMRDAIRTALEATKDAVTVPPSPAPTASPASGSARPFRSGRPAISVIELGASESSVSVMTTSAPPGPGRESAHAPLSETKLSAGVSFAELFNSVERPLARKLEEFLASGDAPGALDACDDLVHRRLAAGTAASGHSDAARDPATACLLLGLDGRRFLRFRALVRSVRQGGEASLLDAKEYYLFLLDVRRAADLLG